MEKDRDDKTRSMRIEILLELILACMAALIKMPQWVICLALFAASIDIIAYIHNWVSGRKEMVDVDISGPVAQLVKQQQDIIIDTWEQFAYPLSRDGKSGKQNGGLSTLEIIESYLQEQDLIDEMGNVKTKETK